jgi:2-dehydropantoate 2-reductase
MKILVLGAGAIGGYFGARLVQAGGDVSFLVRERRAAQLRERGLVVRSPHGDFQVAPATLSAADLRSPFDLVLIACKAYDLASAIDAVRPAVGPASHVLPLLNGIAHIALLQEAFGAERVVGGSCGIPATVSDEGEVVQLAPLHRIVFGMLPQTSADARAKLEELATLFRRTPVDTVLADDMWLELWEKFVGLTTIAAATCLMRASIGDILASEEGPSLIEETYAACVRVAEAAGHAPRAAAQASYRTLLQQRGSALTASMLRDIEAGRPSEGEHVIGDMFHRARAAGVDPAALRHAWCHLQSYEHRRMRESGAETT